MRKTLILIVTGLVFCPLFIGFVVIDSEPRIQVSSGQQVNQADSVTVLLEQIKQLVNERRAPHTISVSPAQTESLAGFLQRAHANAQADAHFELDHASLLLSYHLGHFINDFYLNLEITLRSAKGLDVESIQLGSLSLPGNSALKVIEYAVNTYTHTTIASEAIAWIKQVDIRPKEITLALEPAEALLVQLSKVRRSNEDAYAVLLKKNILYYLKVLEDIPQPKAGDEQRSLSFYLSTLMSQALQTRNSNDAALHNEAALLALAIYAGNYRFARLVGNLGIGINKIPTAPQPPVLAGREDLSLHFIYSAGIKLLSEQNVSIAVGEFKELMDRSEGGSGYSFMDLAADLAGAHFAAQAVDPNKAQYIQSLLAQDSRESLFLPSLEGLEEGLNAQAFASKYQAVDSPAYQQALELINARINDLAVSAQTTNTLKESL